jgi:hypothetical protein
MSTFATIRLVTGYIAHVLLGLYWLWTLSSTVPRIRPGQRDRTRRVKILSIKSAGVAVTALLVGVIHYWATEWWQIAVALLGSLAIGTYLHRSYRKLVTPPRHRITLVNRHQAGARALLETRRHADHPRAPHTPPTHGQRRPTGRELHHRPRVITAHTRI